MGDRPQDCRPAEDRPMSAAPEQIAAVLARVLAQYGLTLEEIERRAAQEGTSR